MPTAAEIEDFVRRNGEKDRGRAVEALTNYTGDRDFDSQGSMYDQRTNSLSAAGRTATAQIVRRQPMLMPTYGAGRNWGNYSPTQGGTMPLPPMAATTQNAYLMPHGIKPPRRTLGEMTGLVDPRATGGR